MHLAAPLNPNICLGCAQLLDDESPFHAVQAGEEDPLFSDNTLIKAGKSPIGSTDCGFPHSRAFR